MSISRLLMTFMLVVTVATGVTSQTRRAPDPADEITLPLATGIRFTNAGRHLVAISPNGSRLVYAANNQLYLQRLDGGLAAPIPGLGGQDNGSPRNPFFSPDGRWIGFWQQRELKKVSIDGGTPTVIGAAQNPQGATWAADNTIVYGQGGGIWRVSADGGTPEQLATVGTTQTAHGPQVLPGGRSILFTLISEGTAQIVAHSIDTGTHRVLLDRAADARYITGGHLVYAQGDTLFAVRFDAATLQTVGAPTRLAGRVAQGSSGVVQFAVAPTGTLVYVPKDALEERSSRRLVWVDRQGREEPVDAPEQMYLDPRVSPDGTRIAVEIENDIWILDRASATLARLTDDPAFESVPVWTPDGRSVIFTVGPSGRSTIAPLNLWRRAADASGPAQRLTENSTTRQVPYAVTPDGMQLVFREHGARPGGDEGDLMIMSLAGDGRSRPLIQTAFREMNAELSPDGRWLAYQSNESGVDEIYVRPFPDVNAGRWRVSTGGGVKPLWRRDGAELFFQSGRALMRTAIAAVATFDAGPPTKLFEGSYVGALERMYDVTPDGQRFLMIEESGSNPALSPRLIVNDRWLGDATATRALFEAIRSSDIGSVRQALARGANVNARNAEGDTTLMSAALYSSAECMRMLVDAGADLNARDARGGTALMRSVRDLDRVRLLVDGGAQVDARSPLGVTALMVAANRPGGSEIVKFLLEHNADPKMPDAAGITPLMYATDFGDLRSVKVLVAAGADVNVGRRNGATPIFWAANGPSEVLSWLLEHGASHNPGSVARSPLIVAAKFGELENVRALLDRGADVNAADDRGTPLIHAVGSDRAGPEIVRLLLDRGANPNVEVKRCEACIHEPIAADGSGDVSALMLARQRGESAIVRMLIAAGARPKPVVPPHPGTAIAQTNHVTVRTAIARSVALLEHSSPIWIKRAGCASCHHQSLPAAAFALARGRGFAVNSDVATEQARVVLARWGRQRENLFQGETGDINGQVINAGYALFGLDAAGVTPNPTTDAIVHYISARQLSDGRFRSPNANRPPLEYSDVSATALAIRALTVYTPPGRKEESSAIVRRAAAWLLSTVPRGTEEKSFQLQGLAWAGVDRAEIARRASRLADEQRADGGWGQLEDLPSDAYATGQALVALARAGGLAIESATYRNGAEFLLKTQHEDGSWLVISRARGTLPYFESGFPHGANQFISAAGTAWATNALLLSLPE